MVSRSAAVAIAAVAAAGLCCTAFVVPSNTAAPAELVQQRAAGTFRPSAAASCGTGLAVLGVVVAAGAALRLRSSTVAPKKQNVVCLKAFESELGAQPPFGFWDPWGFCDDGDQAAFTRRRTVELKHGRISMLACMGYIAPEWIGKFPGYLSPSQGLTFADVPHGLAAITKVPDLGWAQIFAFAANLEANGTLTDEGKLTLRGVEFGSLGFPGAPGVEDAEVRKTKLAAELANGRLAMIAIIGMFFQNGSIGTTGPDMWGWLFEDGTLWLFTLPALLSLAIAGESFRRGPGELFRQEVDRPDVYKAGGRM